VQPGRGATEVALVGEHGERPEVAQLHASNLSIKPYSVLELIVGRGLRSQA
jgi:hypothetical protein